MGRLLPIALTLSAVFGAAPVLAQSQLALSAGLTKEQAEGMTLNEIAAVKFNKGVSLQDQQTVFAHPAPSDEVREFGMATYNASQSYADRNFYQSPPEATSMAFMDTSRRSSHTQLLARAGLTPEEAEGMTLNEIVHVISPD
jgi:hypothetical protein